MQRMRIQQTVFFCSYLKIRRHNGIIVKAFRHEVVFRLTENKAVFAAGKVKSYVRHNEGT